MCEARNEHGVANTWAEILVESKRPLGPVYRPLVWTVSRPPAVAAAAA